MSNKLRPQSGIFDVEGEIRQNGQPLVIRDQALVLSECAVYATSLIDGSTEPKVVAIDTSVSPAYDLTTGLLKAKIMTSLLSEEVLGVAVNNISLNNTGTLITRGIINSTLTSSSVGEPVYSTITGTLSTTLSSRRIGYTLTTGANAKIFVDIKAENLSYINDLVSGSSLNPPGLVAPYVGATAPSGWLLCNGSSYDSTNPIYIPLFNVIGNNYGGVLPLFNVPDYRGMFLRGTGTHGTLTKAAGGNFSGPSLHSSELDQLQGHWHDQFMIGQTAGTGSGSYAFDTTQLAPTTNSGRSAIRSPSTDSTNGTPRTGNETRPVNYGVNYIIKL